MRRRHAIATLALSGLVGCSDDSTSGTGGMGGASASGGGGTSAVGGAGGGAPDPTLLCTELGLPANEWNAGPFGAHRGELADDFTLPLQTGETFTFSTSFSGCESYVFLPDTLVVSELDDTSIWEKDLDDLVAASPKNVHYFFVSRRASDADATASLSAMQTRVEAELGKLAAPDADHWRKHLHVVATKASSIDGWIGDVMVGLGRGGFAIDRAQRIRGVGFLADVHRYNSVLASQNKWPWRSNLAYAAHEALYMNAQADTQARLDAEDATIVSLFDGETLAEFAEVDVALPDAQTMATFDTLEVEVEQACPDPDEIEFGNCGAWDYIASLGLRDEVDATKNVEIARFITSYHRETRWVVDVTPMLALMQSGGSRHFRWDFAPSWNTQPTATKLRLRFSNQGKGMRPISAQYLFGSAPFDSAYNSTRAPIDVAIPPTAAKVELFSIITGHGAGTNQCSEFCNHTHEFTIGGVAFTKAHPEAGTEDLCVPETAHGMVPNQGGTWWFGRGGWCPGKQVDPFVEDVTSAVVPGMTATVSYRGLFNGQDPPDGSGDIDLMSYLVVYE